MPVPQLFSLSYYVNLVYEFSNLSGILAILSPEKKKEEGHLARILQMTGALC